MMKKYMMNRKTYNSVRKMDHSQMSSFLEDVYRRGYKDGCDASEGMTADEIREALLQVKGIGEKKVQVIVAALEAALEEKAEAKKKKDLTR